MSTRRKLKQTKVPRPVEIDQILEEASDDAVPHGSISVPKEKKRPLSNPAVGVDKIARDATGSDNPELQDRLLRLVWGMLWSPNYLTPEETEATRRSAVAMLSCIKPRDEIEGMLAAQMVATHIAAMECLQRASLIDHWPARDMYLRHAERLMAIYTRQMEALDKRRGRAQSPVTMGDLNVHAGGQAVVGHLEMHPLPGPRNPSP